MIAPDAFRETDFYKHFLGPWGYDLAIIGMLDRHGSDHMGIVCPGPREVDASKLKEAVRLLTPHIQRAARISRRIGEADMRIATASEMLDTSPYCVISLDADQQMLMANKSGQALLDRGDGLSITNGRLKIDDAATAKRLADMAAGRSKDRSITFTTSAKNGREIVMTALSVSPEQGGQFANQASGSALILVGGQRIEISDTAIESLQSAFHLTAGEARLACFLLKGTGVRGYAEDKGVSIEAGKYLLKSIYAKTGLSNQTELAALLREAPIGWGQPLPKLLAN